jgi:hypothetical protein
MSEWQEMNTAPLDGTKISLMWKAGEDVGYFDKFSDAHELWLIMPELEGKYGEWSTEKGLAGLDELEPSFWKPLLR